MEFYINLEKGRINTAKLVKRPVQVRGKNGKVYTRMQWVDPKTGMPVSKESHADVQDNTPHHRTQKEHIDAHMKKMSKEEKYHHIQKHGITWKRNDHEAIDHKNAMMALKDHFYKNPHLVGAEHLPTEHDAGKTLDGTDKVNDFANKYKKHPELLYKMMHHLGVTDDHVDPRTVDGQQHTSKGGNGKGDIMHMKNMMALKRHLKENPHHVDEMINHPEFGKPHGSSSASVATAPKPKKAPTQSKAQTGGNTIKGILDTMSSEDKYAICKRLGIAEGDPRLDPSIDSKMAPIHHMKAMMALRKEIEKDPSLLNIDPNTGGISDDEKKRLESLKGKDKDSHEASEFLKRASRELKLKWAEEFDHHDHMKSRPTSDHEHIDNMHKISALKKILTDDPSLMEGLQDELEHEELMNLKIGNKMMGKILRQVAGLKGIGDVVAGYDKGKEWEFGEASTAMIQEDDEGEPILSIVDAGKDGTEYNELVFPLKDIKKFIDGLSGDAKVEPKEVPLHKKMPNDIWKALDEDFDKHYTKEVGNALKANIYQLWDANNRGTYLYGMCQKSSAYIDKSTLAKVLTDLGADVRTDDPARVLMNDNFRKIIYAHKIEKTKTKNATDYLEHDNMNRYRDTYVLHESAKHWTPDERAEARKDFIDQTTHIDDLHHYADGDDRKVKIISHLHKALEHVPFDLFTDVIAHGCKFSFSKTYGGKKHWGNHYNPVSGITFDHGFIDDKHSLMNSTHPMWHRPADRPVPGRPNARYGAHPFSDTVAHEFAHAIDNFFSGKGLNDYNQWEGNQHAEKYAKNHINAISNSYRAAVNKSNPEGLMGMAKGNGGYLLHLDEWMSSYEGRIYDGDYYGQNPPAVTKNSTGSLKDANWEHEAGQIGLEHWSENVSRMANALNAFQMYMKDTGDTGIDLDGWAKLMHTQFTGSGYGDDSTKGSASYSSNRFKPRNDNPSQAYGYLYHTMKQRHPELHKAIKEILFRPDFVGDKSVAGPIERSAKQDHVRKSVDLIINL
jgi:hypothetical protein